MGFIHIYRHKVAKIYEYKMERSDEEIQQNLNAE